MTSRAPQGSANETAPRCAMPGCILAALHDGAHVSHPLTGRASDYSRETPAQAPTPTRQTFIERVVARQWNDEDVRYGALMAGTRHEDAKGPYLIVDVGRYHQALPLGGWLVEHADGRRSVYGDEQFRATYEPVAPPRVSVGSSGGGQGGEATAPAKIDADSQTVLRMISKIVTMTAEREYTSVPLADLRAFARAWTALCQEVVDRESELSTARAALEERTRDAERWQTIEPFLEVAFDDDADVMTLDFHDGESIGVPVYDKDDFGEGLPSVAAAVERLLVSSLESVARGGSGVETPRAEPR